MQQRPIPHVRQAAEKVGGLAELARRLGISHSALYHWPRIPAGRVLPIEKLTGISRHDMRPDLYPREEKTSHEHTTTSRHARRRQKT